MADNATQALASSLITAPLLCRQLAGKAAFDRNQLQLETVPLDLPQLNFQQKLGHLYEDSLQQLLQRSSRFDLLASHLQVFDAQQRTLGELDYLLRERHSGKYIQLELAVKFYLALPLENGWHYPGPNPIDTWSRKYHRLHSHQLTLCQRPEARALLRHRYQVDSVDAQHLIYGVIFRPLNAPYAPLPDTVNPQCRQGSWLYCQEWEQHFSQIEHVWLIPKALWPVDFRQPDRELMTQISADELRKQAQQRALLFQNPYDHRPCFIMPASWPSM